jgi:hypothetical protein
MRWYQRPLTHFVIAGLVLFIGEKVWLEFTREDVVVDRGPIVIDVAALREEQSGSLGRPLLAEEELGLIRLEIDTELLYREALNRRLDVGDRAIRGWLIRKMRFVSDDPELSDEELYQQALQLQLDEGDQVVRRSLVEKMRLLSGILNPPAEPTDAELLAYMDEQSDLFREPARVSLEHVFLSRDRRPETVDEDARELLAEIGEQENPDWARLGDPFPLGREFQARSQRQLASSFGANFAREAFVLPEGEWAGPVSSAYGQHLVRLTDRRDSRMPELDSVRNQLRHRLLSERREESLAAMVAELRESSRGELFVEFPDERGRMEADVVFAP